MKFLYLVNKDLCRSDYLGVKYKIFGQINAFNAINEVSMHLLAIEDNYLVLRDDKLSIIFSTELKNNYLIKSKQIKKELSKFLQLYQYEFIYYRYAVGDFLMSSILRYAQKKYVFKLIVEVATYPYVDEIDKSFLSLLDKVSVNLLSQSISFIVSYTIEEPIFGKRVVHINNALDKEFVEAIKSKIFQSYANAKQEIHFIGIGNLSKWHGYDRLIKSIAEYANGVQKPDYKIVFNIVGQGKEFDYLVSLSKEYKIENNCIFHGFLEREEIVNLINFNSIGVSALANHRRGLSGDKSLKNREYIAYGLPLIKAGLDYQLDEIYDGFINIDSNEEEFNLKEVLDSYQMLSGKDKLDFFIRNNKFAEKYLCWNSEVEKIIDVANEVKNDG
ncbi:MAG: hypothetical protein CVU87_11000 [Firmicutes bacterium HGW-Firmicutes-12]|jgi:glycosyltransferase involved in cell wall biosynthesis|nr:MAG: hypothetical protein CVU87_11000 [Firmicutes bacterium HGW-Firmicutes-12]